MVREKETGNTEHLFEKYVSEEICQGREEIVNQKIFIEYLLYSRHWVLVIKRKIKESSQNDVALRM